MQAALRVALIAAGLLRMAPVHALAEPTAPAASVAPVAGTKSGAGMWPGEAFTFKFSVGAVESGRARMAVGAPFRSGGRRLVAIRGQAETASWLQLFVRLDDEYQLTLDL